MENEIVVMRRNRLTPDAYRTQISALSIDEESEREDDSDIENVEKDVKDFP